MQRVGLLLLIVSLVIQTLVALVLFQSSNFDLTEQGDTDEYVAIADNIINGNGYSAEREAPWRPTGSRSPGMLITNVPLRLLFSGSDMLAVIFGKILLVPMILFFLITVKYFEDSDFTIYAALALTIIPSFAYYMTNPYASNPPYLLALTAVFASMVLTMQLQRVGVVLLLFAAMYCMSTRPAAMFLLVWLGVTSFGAGWLLKVPQIRRNLQIIGIVVLIGTGITYLSWSYRNYQEFDSFQYSTVGGFNLLHFNVEGMTPYLSEPGKQEVEAALESYPIYIHRYHGRDQFEIADTQGEEAMQIIKKYPVEFVVSHMVGVVKAFFLFDVAYLAKILGTTPTYITAVYQTLLTLAACYGLFIRFNKLDQSRKTILLLLLTTGLVSVLSSGVLGDPKFRIPLEPVVALGLLFFFQDYMVVKLLPRFGIVLPPYGSDTSDDSRSSLTRAEMLPRRKSLVR